MSRTEIVVILPLIVLAAAPVLIMLSIAVRRNYEVSAALAFLGLAVALVMLPVASMEGSRQSTVLLLMDNYALFFMGLLFATGLVLALLSYRYLKVHAGNHEEFWILLLLATLGSSVLVASTHFVSFFLGLEILSISLYALVGYQRTSQIGIEAAIKYLVLAAVSTAFLLFGMALVYAETGSMEFGQIASLRAGLGDPERVIFLAGMGLMVVGIGYKLAVVPFHMWAPDVYEGAPAPVTALIATVSKGGMFALLLRLFTQIGFRADDELFWLFTAIAIASMFAGNLLALMQNNVKRILAYSSIAHLGYLLTAFLASGSLAVTAVTFYFIAYFIASVGSFGVMTVLSGPERDADQIEDYRGLFWTRPWLAAVFTIMLLSMAGMPLTAGFLGKFYLVAAGAQASLWALVIILVATSVIGLFYYLRIIVAMYSQPAEEARATGPLPLPSPSETLVLAMATSLALWLGVYPAPLIHIIPSFIR
ncbi:MAG: NADH-quinone oxidoreductase subunit N [Dehalococcoidia bacterium]|jgi:NADH-quinone oxidoreductase subunit N